MVRKAVIKVDDHAVEGVSTNRAKGEKMILEPPMNSAQRRTLGDITNLPTRNIAMNNEANQQQQSMSLSSKEYAEKLQKENMRLMKALTERNAIIERSGSELQKYRTNLQMVHVQNFQLAQTNTRILAEIRTSKDQLKALQHELSCKNGVLMSRKLPIESQNLPCTRHHPSEDKDRATASRGAPETFHPKASESSECNSLQINEKANKKRVSGRSSPANSEVLDINGRPGDSVRTTNIRRVSLRRQSGRFNIQELGVTKNLIGIHDGQEFAAKARCSSSDLSIGLKPEAVELHDTKEITGKSRKVSSRRQSTEVKSQSAIKVSTDPPLHDDIVEESSQVLSSVSVELNRESNNKPRGDEAEEMRETYAGRPSRQAAAKIKSYDIDEESSQVSSSVSTELNRESKKKDEAGEMRETYVGRPSRQAAAKIKSYKEVSLKEKMRRDF